MTKEEVAYAIMKENSFRFRFVCSLLILEDNKRKQINPSGEGDLSKIILDSQKQLYYRQKVQDILPLFHQSQNEAI